MKLSLKTLRAMNLKKLPLQKLKLQFLKLQNAQSSSKRDRPLVNSSSAAKQPLTLSKGLPNRLSQVFSQESKSSRIALNLVLVRPWVLVAGFWLVSVASAGMAFDGLISPKKLTMALPEPALDTAANTPARSFLNVELGDADIGSTQVDPPTAEAVAAPKTTATSTQSDFPVWPLGLLVGTCATGCLVMSRRRAMARLAAVRSRQATRRDANGQVRKPHFASQLSSKTPAARLAATKIAGAKATGAQSPGLKMASVKAPMKTAAKVSASVKSSASKPSGGRSGFSSMVKNRRQRHRRPAVSVPAIAGTQVLVSRSAAQKATAQRMTPQKATAKKTSASSATQFSPRPIKRAPSQIASRPSVVSVVPASESHVLDWTNGSLAHQLDVRPQRSAM
ncbi:MAG: hypothetical protein DCF15_18150 [Phormidesmis priestleyi]|uniref:Transmembrane protein n=1 Tax=Phormidesmis priestleyi TaxID=268141 RepID=A0A2W4WSQ0_9CYAN|nr:MAG: hypothetical protein DCF15_18150 [Phormidesmis priestleyi]